MSTESSTCRRRCAVRSRSRVPTLCKRHGQRAAAVHSNADATVRELLPPSSPPSFVLLMKLIYPCASFAFAVLVSFAVPVTNTSTTPQRDCDDDDDDVENDTREFMDVERRETCLCRCAGCSNDLIKKLQSLRPTVISNLIAH